MNHEYRCPRPEKRGWEQRDTAKRWLRRLLSMGGPDHGLHVYKCACGLFHVGHPVKAEAA